MIPVDVSNFILFQLKQPFHAIHLRPSKIIHTSFYKHCKCYWPRRHWCTCLARLGNCARKRGCDWPKLRDQ